MRHYARFLQIDSQFFNFKLLASQTIKVYFSKTTTLQTLMFDYYFHMVNVHITLEVH